MGGSKLGSNCKPPLMLCKSLLLRGSERIGITEDVIVRDRAEDLMDH